MTTDERELWRRLKQAQRERTSGTAGRILTIQCPGGHEIGNAWNTSVGLYIWAGRIMAQGDKARRWPNGWIDDGKDGPIPLDCLRCKPWARYKPTWSLIAAAAINPRVSKLRLPLESRTMTFNIP
jgi:hypothetical protein